MFILEAYWTLLYFRSAPRYVNSTSYAYYGCAMEKPRLWSLLKHLWSTANGEKCKLSRVISWSGRNIFSKLELILFDCTLQLRIQRILQVGMIYVVQNCSTLFEIQCAAKQLGSTFSMESGLINKYIRNCSENSKVYVYF